MPFFNRPYENFPAHCLQRGGSVVGATRIADFQIDNGRNGRDKRQELPSNSS